MSTNFATGEPGIEDLFACRRRPWTVAGQRGLRGKKTRERRVQRLAQLAPEEIENEGRRRLGERRAQALALSFVDNLSVGSRHKRLITGWSEQNTAYASRYTDLPSTLQTGKKS